MGDYMMKKRVLFLLHDTRVHGGANSSMFDVLDNLNNVDIFVAIPKKDEEMTEYLNQKGYKWFVISYPGWIYRIYNPWYKKVIRVPQQFLRQFRLISVMPQLKKIIAENNIDTIYTNTFCMYVGCLAKKMWNIRHIWHIREYGAEDHGFGIIFGNHVFLKLLNKYTDQIIFISKSLANKYLTEIEDKSKVHVIYDDVSDRYIVKKSKHDDYINILVAGLIQAGKGQLEIVKAFEQAAQRMSTMKLFIAGETGSTYYKAVKQYVDEHQLSDKVEFLGFVTNMNELRSHMDIGVVASRSEAFGRVTIEGMLAHMAMIGADAAGTSELITDGETGLLYEPGNIEELSQKMLLLCQDSIRRRQIQENGYMYAKDTYTNHNCAKKIEGLLI
ncbi:glycosyltransferase [Streptococcus thermophilus]|nr:glycosyltransferase [Streptococcus thermophilus]MCE2128648.1 glycosyltransferase [Streptococcus thermophilus]MCE2136197.1 glycosyltransferase [Streptococcus thermophilus]